jgi:transposase-like protein
MLIVGFDDKAVECDLLAGLLSCPPCGGVLGPWGYGRWRTLRRNGQDERAHPRRSRCRVCKTTQILLPDRWLVRRRDDVESIGRAILDNARGVGYRQLAKTLGRWENTVRRWLRAFRDRAEAIRSHFTLWAHALDVDLGPIGATGSPVGDAVEAIGVAARAAVQRYGSISPWAIASRLSAGALLCNTNRALSPLPTS